MGAPGSAAARPVRRIRWAAWGQTAAAFILILIAWQVVNAVRYRDNKLFTRGFLVVTPGITIKDRLQVLQPNHAQSYYAQRELVPTDMLQAIGKANIVITNYHAFKLSETMPLTSGTRALPRGRHGPESRRSNPRARCCSASCPG